MMKNKMMRVASLLLVAVMLSTCTISGTFAKYVTTNAADDSARVAKFGVIIQADGSLYGTNYDTAFKPTVVDSAASLLVKSIPVGNDPAENVVAPGMQSDKGLYFSLTGTPEVRTELEVTITAENIFLKEGTYAVMVPTTFVTAVNFKANTYYTKSGAGSYTLARAFDEDVTTYYTIESIAIVAANGQTDGDDYYYPVVYDADLTNGTYGADSLKAIVADYATRLVDVATPTSTEQEGAKYTYEGSKVYDVNYDYADLGVDAETLTWEWAFEGVNDGADTILAYLMEGDFSRGEVVKVATFNTVDDTQVVATTVAPTEHVDYHLTTSFSIEITVTQVNA